VVRVSITRDLGPCQDLVCYKYWHAIDSALCSLHDLRYEISESELKPPIFILDCVFKGRKLHFHDSQIIEFRSLFPENDNNGSYVGKTIPQSIKESVQTISFRPFFCILICIKF